MFGLVRNASMILGGVFGLKVINDLVYFAFEVFSLHSLNKIIKIFILDLFYYILLRLGPNSSWPRFVVFHDLFIKKVSFDELYYINIFHPCLDHVL